jgi:hypothetical protein
MQRLNLLEDVPPMPDRLPSAAISALENLLSPVRAIGCGQVLNLSLGSSERQS